MKLRQGPDRARGAVLLSAALVAACGPEQELVAAAQDTQPRSEEPIAFPVEDDRRGRALDGLRFEPNEGQAPADASFVGRTSRYAVDATASGVRLRHAGASVAIVLEGAAPLAWVPREPLSSWSNYLMGEVESEWRSHVPHYASLRAASAYEGVDVIARADGPLLRYDFAVLPGADPNVIALRFDDDADVTIDAVGNLRISVGTVSFGQRPPLAWQIIGGSPVTVDVQYRLDEEGAVRFDIGPYEEEVALLIDPTLVLSSVFGGAAFDQVTDLVSDRDGGVYAVGQTQSEDFSNGNDALDGDLSGLGDVFIAHLDRKGALVWTTFLGGERFERSPRVARRADGSLLVALTTTSADLPQAGGFQTRPSAYSAGYLAALTADGADLLFATFFGGEETEGVVQGGPGTAVSDLAVDRDGAAYVYGTTNTEDMPTTPGALLEVALDGDVDTNPRSGGPFLLKVAADGSALVYGTYLPVDTGIDFNRREGGLAVDLAGAAHVVDSGRGQLLVTADAAQPALGGEYDAFLMKVSADGTALDYATYLGGSGLDLAYGVVVDRFGHVYVAGEESSRDFGDLIVGSSSSDELRRPFVARVSPADGPSLVISSIGRDVSTGIQGLALAPDGAPTVALADVDGGVLVTRLSPMLDAIGPSVTVDQEDVGESFRVVARAVAVTADGDAWIGGSVGSPAAAGQQELGRDALVAKVSLTFAADFTTDGSEDLADRLQVTVTSDDDIARVEGRVGDGPWLSLASTNGDSWETFTSTPHASHVQFRAINAAGNVALSDLYLWPYGAAVPDDDGFAARFVGLRGNPWWIETDIAANEPVTKVEVRLNDGPAWLPLTLREWGSWAASHHAPDGAVIEVRATSTRGATFTSTRLSWPSGEPLTAAEPFDARFFGVRGNSWWVETEVSGNASVVDVRAVINAETYTMNRTAWGSWSVSVFVPEGALVQFTARSIGDETDVSDRYRWPDATPVTGSGEEPFTVSFSGLRGNEWWVETDVGADQPIAGVDARVGEGAWQSLARTSWGSWADSLFVPAGSSVQFRAVATSGEEALSGSYAWPP